VFDAADYAAKEIARQVAEGGANSSIPGVESSIDAEAEREREQQRKKKRSDNIRPSQQELQDQADAVVARLAAEVEVWSQRVKVVRAPLLKEVRGAFTPWGDHQ
jgi:hypothetical protein